MLRMSEALADAIQEKGYDLAPGSIGRGSMSSVYKITDKKNQAYALKALHDFEKEDERDDADKQNRKEIALLTYLEDCLRNSI